MPKKMTKEIRAKRSKKDSAPDTDPRKPGEVTPKLRRRMHDPLADIFSETGVQLYEKSVDAIKNALTEIFQSGIGELGEEIKTKLGEYGYEDSVDHFRPWMQDVVKDVFGPGMEEVVGALEGMVSSLSVQYTGEGEEGGESMSDLLGTEIPSVSEDEVEEVSEDEEGGFDFGDEDAAASEDTEEVVEEEAPKEASAKTAAYKPSKAVRAVYASSKNRYRLRMAAIEKLRQFDADLAQ